MALVESTTPPDFRVSFDSLAPHYRLMERLLAGNKLQRARLRWLNHIGKPKNILLVGEGHGRFLNECLDHFPDAAITVVDASAGMLMEALKACPSAMGRKHPVQFVHASLPSWPPPSREFDLIVTNFFFDCFPEDEIASIVESLAMAATPNACWLVAEFAIPPRGWMKIRAQLILAMAYAFFRRATKLSSRAIPRYDLAFKKTGFHLGQIDHFEWGLIKAELWSNSEHPGM